MVEIILRKDIQDYEARPLFGFTYRQVATGAAIWKADRDWPKVALFAAPTLSPHGDRASAKAKAGKRPKKETKAEKAAALEADAEAEA